MILSIIILKLLLERSSGSFYHYVKLFFFVVVEFYEVSCELLITITLEGCLLSIVGSGIF